MQAKPHHPRSKASSSRSDMPTQSSDSHHSLQEKLEFAISSMNKSLSIYEHLLQVAQTQVLQLRIPETLLYSDNHLVLLFCDANGTLRVSKGEMVTHSFEMMAGEKIKQMQNLNPRGVHFPKYITFAGDRVEHTIHHKADLPLYFPNMTSNSRIQRFIWPEDFLVKKTIVVWRRTKLTKAYTLSPRGGFRPTSKKPLKLESASGFTLDSSYIVSSHFIRSNDVTKERVTEEIEHFLETMREVLCAHALAPEERLEELIVFLCKSLDGKMYFLDLPLAKVSIHKNSPSMQRRCLTPARVSALMHELEASARLKSKFLPYLNLSDMSEQSHRLYELHLHSASLEPDHIDTSRVKTFSEELASQRLTEVSCQFDSLVRESQELKKEFGIVMKVQLTKYPKDLLDHVIRHVYENILKDPRLSKYYLDKSRIYQKLVVAVKAVFMCGLSRNIRARMRTVHMGMGITDYDFDLYLKYFAEAMRHMNVEEEDVEQTADFLNCFRPDVVQHLLNEPSS